MRILCERTSSLKPPVILVFGLGSRAILIFLTLLRLVLVALHRLVGIPGQESEKPGVNWRDIGVAVLSIKSVEVDIRILQVGRLDRGLAKDSGACGVDMVSRGARRAVDSRAADETAAG